MFQSWQHHTLPATPLLEHVDETTPARPRPTPPVDTHHTGPMPTPRWTPSAPPPARDAADAGFDDAAIRRDGGTQGMLERMQTRAELYAAIGYHDYEALDASIVKTVVPQGMPQEAA